MRALIIDEAAKQKIADVITFAIKHPYDRSKLLRAMEGLIKPPGDVRGHVCFIEMGFKCVYTIEDQPLGWAHHLSVSVNDPVKLPSTYAVEMLAKEFGIEVPLNECYVYVEEKSMPKSINIIAKK